MNNLCADIGWKSINHEGEQLCGDHIDIVDQGDNSTVVVLADGLGSGVKASILSTLTSKIISTMLASGLKLEDCVSTIAATLPVCSVRGVAYSTFTILRIVNNLRAEIIQYDNPRVILLRDGKNFEIPTTSLSIAGKEVLRSEITLRENDVFIAMSDGVEHAGVGGIYNFGCPNHRNSHSLFTEAAILMGLSNPASWILPDTERFAEQERNLTMDCARIEAHGIHFPDSLTGIEAALRWPFRTE